MVNVLKYVDSLFFSETPDDTVDDLNITNQSVRSNITRKRFIPDVTGILSIIEEPSLVEFITNNKNSIEFRLNLDDCLERLKAEAVYILQLSENLTQKPPPTNGNGNGKLLSDKDDSCEEEDGLKRKLVKRDKIGRTRSLNESILNGGSRKNSTNEGPTTKSLPIFDSKSIESESGEDDGEVLSNSELNIRLHELKNRLVKSEDEKKSLELELASTKEQLEVLEGQKEIFMEGFGSNILSPRHQATLQRTTSLIDLQERAKNILNTSHNQTSGENTQLLMQLVEDFCREGDRFMEEGKKDKDDLQSQVFFEWIVYFYNLA